MARGSRVNERVNIVQDPLSILLAKTGWFSVWIVRGGYDKCRKRAKGVVWFKKSKTRPWHEDCAESDRGSAVCHVPLDLGRRSNLLDRNPALVVNNLCHVQPRVQSNVR